MVKQEDKKKEKPNRSDQTEKGRQRDKQNSHYIYKNPHTHNKQLSEFVLKHRHIIDRHDGYVITFACVFLHYSKHLSGVVCSRRFLFIAHNVPSNGNICAQFALHMTKSWLLHVFDNDVEF